MFTRAAGIGRKTAERVIVELRSKVQSSKTGAVVDKMQTDSDLVEALMSLGYHRDQARAALGKVDEKVSVRRHACAPRSRRWQISKNRLH